MKVYLFPGQGAQFPGMGKELYDKSPAARAVFDGAREILGFDIISTMFCGSDEQLRETSVTQPAVFIHSVAAARALDNFAPDMVAGHSLGEFSALVAAGAMEFEDALRLVSARANAMHEACRQNPGKMAAVIMLDYEVVKKVCAATGGVVVPANINSPEQIVISGDAAAVDEACKAAKAAGAKRALPLPVGGAFHSPLMEPARAKLAEAIASVPFRKPVCPVYQNVDARPHTDPGEIKANLIAQLTSPVLWSHTIIHMVEDGATDFTELGPGNVLTNLLDKIIY